MIELTKEQKEVCDFAVDRVRKRKMLTTIGGYAGVGKTTITSEIVKMIRSINPDSRFAFMCYTGKAKSILEKKLMAADAMKAGDSCGTIHQFLYRPITSYKHDDDEKTIEKITTFESRDEKDRPSVIIIDEASMIDERIFEELEEMNIPIIAIGDHGQLPPVFGNFNLMADPMIRLDKIHRQAESNPIIRLSMMAREDGCIPVGTYGSEGSVHHVVKTNDGTVVGKLADPEAWTFICGTNKKRTMLNKWVRQRKFGAHHDDPQIGEKVICLQNNHGARICNGMIGHIRELELYEKNWYRARIEMDGFDYSGLIFRWQFAKEKTCNKTVPEAPDVHPDNFEDRFDFGYALTAHKAQGSEANNVVVYEEKGMRMMLERMHGEECWRRWIYTAVTRAKQNLIIIGD